MVASIRTFGFVKVLNAVRAIGAAGREVQGSLAAFGSPLPYTYGIEKGKTRSGRLARRAGPARMFGRVAADVQAEARRILPAAVVRGPRSVGQAKRRLRDYGVERVRKYTPVRSGDLRDSVRELSRPR